MKPLQQLHAEYAALYPLAQAASQRLDTWSKSMVRKVAESEVCTSYTIEPVDETPEVKADKDIILKYNNAHRAFAGAVADVNVALRDKFDTEQHKFASGWHQLYNNCIKQLNNIARQGHSHPWETIKNTLEQEKQTLTSIMEKFTLSDDQAALRKQYMENLVVYNDAVKTINSTRKKLQKAPDTPRYIKRLAKATATYEQYKPIVDKLKAQLEV